MKKLLFAMFAFALCLGMTSCKDEAGKGKDEDKKEVKGDKNDREEISADQKVEKSSFGASMEEIVAMAKEEGESWSVDEWKEQYRNMVKAAKPMLDEMKAFQKNMEDADEDEMTELLAKAAEFETKYKKEIKLMDEFGDIASKAPNGQKVEEDEAFMKELEKEFGLDMLDD